MDQFHDVLQSLELPVEIKERPNAINMRDLNQGIRFDNVSFNYAACEEAYTVLPKRT